MQRNNDGQGGSCLPSVDAANTSYDVAAEAVPMVNPVATDRSNIDMIIIIEFFIVISFLNNLVVLIRLRTNVEALTAGSH